MNKRIEYPASTLFFDTTKRKWYVNATIPKDLRSHFKGRTQIRRSTGTADSNDAKRKQHALTEKIYLEFDQANVDPLTEAMFKLGNLAPKTDLYNPSIQPTEPIGRMAQGDLDSCLAFLDKTRLQCELWQETEVFTELGDAAISFLKAYDQMCTSPEENNSRQLSTFVEPYFLKPPHKREKENRAAKRYIEDFCTFTGNPAIQSITKRDAYQFAEYLEDSGLSNSTIKTRIGSIRSLLGYLERKGELEQTPWEGLKLAGYGIAKKNYKPLGKGLLHKLFEQNLPENIRLLFAILISTGMRLDEATLLRWEDINFDMGIWYFDLTDESKVLKNVGSARKVPIIEPVKNHLALVDSPHNRSGRLFPEFKTNADGKAQGPASKALMPWIRNITPNELHVNHSLRGDFKDLCRDKQVPKEQHDFITGHSMGDSASSYGEGPSLQTRLEILSSLDHPWLDLS